MTGIETLQTLVSLNIKIYTHYMNGHSRAPTVVIGYFIAKGSSAERLKNWLQQNALQSILMTVNEQY